MTLERAARDSNADRGSARLRGLRVVVAGGASGIGAATVERLSSEGAAVVVADIDADGAEQLAARLTDRGSVVRAAPVDLRDAGSVETLVRSAADLLGGLDALVNVGADLSRETLDADGDLLSTTDAVWMSTLDLNLLGYVRTSRAALPILIEAGGGSIVNLSSGASFIGEPTRPAYAASKAAVEALTRHVARRWGRDGVRCNAIAPGLVETPPVLATLDGASRARMARGTALGRLGAPDDIAGAVAFLVSEDAAWVSGQVWIVDGGQNFRS